MSLGTLKPSTAATNVETGVSAIISVYLPPVISINLPAVFSPRLLEKANAFDSDSDDSFAASKLSSLNSCYPSNIIIPTYSSMFPFSFNLKKQLNCLIRPELIRLNKQENNSAGRKLEYKKSKLSMSGTTVRCISCTSKTVFE